MFSFFFDRNSKFVKVVEYVGIAMFGWIFIKGDIFAQSLLFKILFAIYFLGFAFVKFCGHYNWYAKFKIKENERGIRVHFKKCMVASTYVMFLVNLLMLIAPSVIWLLFAVLFFIAEIHLHLILLYLHFRDKSALPPNYFSSEHS